METKNRNSLATADLRDLSRPVAEKGGEKGGGWNKEGLEIGLGKIGLGLE